MWQKLYKSLKGLPQKRIVSYRYLKFKSEGRKVVLVFK